MIYNESSDINMNIANVEEDPEFIPNEFTEPCHIHVINPENHPEMKSDDYDEDFDDDEVEEDEEEDDILFSDGYVNYSNMFIDTDGDEVDEEFELSPDDFDREE